MRSDTIEVVITKDEALVLFEWLTQLDSSDISLRDGSAEQRVVWKLEGILEKFLVEPLSPDYGRLIEEAKKRVLSAN